MSILEPALYPLAYASLSTLQQAPGKAVLPGAQNGDMLDVLRSRARDRIGLP
ncbi:MAG: hypothetical protein WAU45_19980 [Blastocatellia bacterium]